MNMDLCGYPTHPHQSISSLSSSFVCNWVEKFPTMLSLVLANLLSTLFILCFISGWFHMVLEAMTGALIGQASESGLVRGAEVGAISGAVFSIHVFDSSLLLWHSLLVCLVYLIDVIVSLVSGRLVRERMGPAILNIVLTQMESMESGGGLEQGSNIFERGERRKGLAGDIVEKIPKMIIRKKEEDGSDGSDGSAGVSCSICLQELEIGQVVRRLPHCQHLFHVRCIDKWLLNHSSCPLCRRDL